MSHIQEPPANERIAALRQRLESEEDGTPANFSLEEIMELFYNRPCRRVNPQDYSVRKCKFARGSVLITEKEVVLVLEPEDNTLNFRHRRMRFSSPKGKHFKGLLPRSRVITLGGTLIRFEDRLEVGNLRETVRLHRIELEEIGSPAGSGFFEHDEGGGLNDHRCDEAFGLHAYRSASRWKKALPLIAAGDVWVL